MSNEEGVELIFLVAPVRILAKEGWLTEVKGIRMQPGEPDALGRRKPVGTPMWSIRLPCATQHGMDCAGGPVWRYRARPAGLWAEAVCQGLDAAESIHRYAQGMI